MTKRYKFKQWSIKLPANWGAERKGYCVILTAENGVGALQIITRRHDSKNFAFNNLPDFTEDKLVEGLDLQNVKCGEFTGIGISYLVDSNYLRKWWLWRDSLLLYVTYNCLAEELLVEMDTVDWMMKSFKYYPF